MSFGCLQVKTLAPKTQKAGLKYSGSLFLRRGMLPTLIMLGGLGAMAQQAPRPDAGSLQEPQSPLPLLPAPGSPAIVLPALPSSPVAAVPLRITPRAFRFLGNTVFDQAHLANLLADAAGQATTLAGLNELANRVGKYYREQGYLLTEVYLPEQALKAEGGEVTFTVIEARVGRVRVELDETQGSASYARRVLAHNLRPGMLITEYLLDKPVLLLRDLAGMEASATVEPGEKLGEADVTVAVRSLGTQVDAAVGANNHGSGSVAATQLHADLNISNALGRGDVFSARMQQGEAGNSQLYRLSYTLPVGAAGTRLAVNAAHTRYALGRQFAALGASGKADIAGLSLTHPLVRARQRNIYGVIGLDHKRFEDLVSTPYNNSERRIVATRLGLLGNHVGALLGAGSFNSYALTWTVGRLGLDPGTQAIDQGSGGERASGSFDKLNLDYQRVDYLSREASLHLNLQSQQAGKNLASAEKMSLGGPNGVRGYPVGEGVGDSGALINLEYRHQLPAPATLAGEPVSLVLFYDLGAVEFHKDPAGMGLSSNRQVLGAVGVGMLAGRSNKYRVSAHLAWRTTQAAPTTGDADQTPRVWVTAQKWL
jgi:hemolysin activation/secretion protein